MMFVYNGIKVMALGLAEICFQYKYNCLCPVYYKYINTVCFYKCYNLVNYKKAFLTIRYKVDMGSMIFVKYFV